MIDTKSPPIDAAFSVTPKIAIDRRTRLTFNALGVASTALVALLPVAVAGYWLTADPLVTAQALRLPAGAVGVPDISTRLLAFLLSLPAVIPLSWALSRLRVCFGEFAQGRLFTARGVLGLRDFAVGTGLSALGKPISTTLLTPFLSWGAPAGQRQIVVTLDSDTLLLALFAATVASLAWAMEKAAAIAEENSQFV